MKRTAPHYHVIIQTYLGPTNHRGARIKLTSPRLASSIVINRDYDVEAVDQAREELSARGYTIVGEADLQDKHLFLCTEFKALARR
jgi:hypothetical protein